MIRIKGPIPTGLLLDHASSLQRAVAAEARRRAPLVLLRPDLPAANAVTDTRWNVVVNEELEVDT